MTYTTNCNLEKNREEIISAIESILKPVAKTMSPLGGNVVYKTSEGLVLSTNDGATIAKMINPKGELEKIIVKAIVDASENTNKLEGDATSTTILMTGTLLLDYINQKDKYGSTFNYLKELRKARDFILTELPNHKLEPTEELLKKIAFISANNDSSISDIAFNVAKNVGEYGIVKYDMSKSKPGYSFDKGYIIHDAIGHPMFIHNKPKEVFHNTGVFVTTMNLFYAEHLNTILKEYDNSGYKNIVIIAPQFQGKIPETIVQIIEKKMGIHIIPIEIESEEIIEDIAAYLNVRLYTKGIGAPTPDKVNLCKGMIPELSANNQFVIFKNEVEGNSKLDERVKYLEALLESSDEPDKIKERLSSLTTGIATLSPGGATDIEKIERQLRFDDSIRAVQRAKTNGCLPGGGVALRDIYVESSIENDIANSVCNVNSNQILKNCGVVEPTHIPDKGIGYNALTGEYVNVVEAGIIDSYSAVEQALKNAFSTAEQLISAFDNAIITINDDK